MNPDTYDQREALYDAQLAQAKNEKVVRITVLADEYERQCANSRRYEYLTRHVYPSLFKELWDDVIEGGMSWDQVIDQEMQYG